MSRSTLRIAILIFGLFTALVHLYLNIRLKCFTPQAQGICPDPAFTANGVGYLVLLGAFFFNPPFLRGRERLLHYVFMAFAAVTIVAFLIMGDKRDILGWVTKADEALLIAALWLHLRQTPQNA